MRVRVRVRASVTACGCVSTVVSCFLRKGRCTESPHTGLSQRAHGLTRAECAHRDGVRGGGGQPFEQAHTVTRATRAGAVHCACVERIST